MPTVAGGRLGAEEGEGACAKGGRAGSESRAEPAAAPGGLGAPHPRLDRNPRACDISAWAAFCGIIVGCSSTSTSVPKRMATSMSFSFQQSHLRARYSFRQGGGRERDSERARDDR